MAKKRVRNLPTNRQLAARDGGSPWQQRQQSEPLPESSGRIWAETHPREWQRLKRRALAHVLRGGEITPGWVSMWFAMSQRAYSGRRVTTAKPRPKRDGQRDNFILEVVAVLSNSNATIALHTTIPDTYPTR